MQRRRSIAFRRTPYQTAHINVQYNQLICKLYAIRCINFNTIFRCTLKVGSISAVFHSVSEQRPPSVAEKNNTFQFTPMYPAVSIDGSSRSWYVYVCVYWRPNHFGPKSTYAFQHAWAPQPGLVTQEEGQHRSFSPFPPREQGSAAPFSR